jgi:broad specificity phosphatase PhoE
MSKTLLLIKHALPEIRPELPAPRWELGEVGRADAKKLVPRLAVYKVDRLVTSDEPKAIETGKILAGELNISWEARSGLQEHSRNTIGFLERSLFEEKVRLLFENPTADNFGDETGYDANLRFSKTIKEIINLYDSSENLAVVTHGTVISLFCAAHDSRIDGFSLWRLLQLPAVVVLDAQTFRVREILGEPIC